jgi:predicted phage-related endonuclease
MSVLTENRDHESWARWRAEGITATDVADAAAGTYGGAYAVVARKLGKLPPPEINDAMQRGHRWQPVVADAVHALTGLYVVGEETWCQHADDDRWRATVDGFLAAQPMATLEELLELLETKTVGVNVRPNRERWEHQVQWQLLVTGLSSAVIAEATIDDLDDSCVGIRLHRLTADPLAQSVLLSVAEDLWRHIEAGTVPDPDTPGALDAVKAIHAAADPDAEPVDLTPIAADVVRFADIKAALKAVQDEHDELEARIRAAVGDATKGICDGVTVAVSKPAAVLTREAEAELLAERPDLGRVVLDRDRAKREAPEAYDAARTPTGARRLTIRTTGENR